MVLPSSWIIVAFWIVAIVSTVVAFAIGLISRVILALYIAIGPLLIGVALFPATRSMLERGIGSLVSCVILQITASVLYRAQHSPAAQEIKRIRRLRSA